MRARRSPPFHPSALQPGRRARRPTRPALIVVLAVATLAALLALAAFGVLDPPGSIG